MDALQFSQYSCYNSDNSTPRTPSPNVDDLAGYTHPKATVLDMDPLRNLYVQEDSVTQDLHWSASFNAYPRGSLLQELYDHHDGSSDHTGHEVYLDNCPHSQWQQHQIQQQHQHIHHHQQQPHRAQDSYPMIRRNTFPYARHDSREEHYPPYINTQTDFYRHDGVYLDSVPLSANPSSLASPYSLVSSPHSSYHLEDPAAGPVKLEDAPVIVPSQPSFYRATAHHQHAVPHQPSNLANGYISPHTGLPVQHTDDAASKETQYLRRRCFNCHTTEPPSWRRSTLNPGKIVCNKCGLYERTHLRPRPLRFDELRAGNKARKQSGANQSQGLTLSTSNLSPKSSSSPKSVKSASVLVKKEPKEFNGVLHRRSSVSSSGTSQGGVSDWDDSVSNYSAASAPPASFGSPDFGYPLPLSRGDSSSPPRDGGIRLPQTPLSEVASLNLSLPSNLSSPSPRSATSYYSPPSLSSSPLTSPESPIGQPELAFRRSAVPELSNGWDGSPAEGSQPTAVAP